jgi:putative restriction endonuclease
VSYLKDGYCSAAIRDFQNFLVEYRNEKKLRAVFEAHVGDEDGVVEALKIPFELPKCLIDGLSKKEGKEMLRVVKTRTNQRVFQSIVMKNFGGACCITGLDVREVNRASHIIPWAEREDIRLDPRNGLFLSATYDAAFDRNLISLDDDYQVILSKDLKENYTSESYGEYFKQKEGVEIRLPSAYLPKKEYLQCHRENGRF